MAYAYKSYQRVAAKVAQDKEKHPEKFCPTPRCLYRTGGGYCPRHGQPVIRVYCDQCKAFYPESETKFQNIEEDIQGHDVLTFECPKGHSGRRSNRVG
jgi:hypothetical protein